MKVWCVFLIVPNEYNDYYLKGVFDPEQKAQTFLKKNKDIHPNEIQEWELQ